MDKSLIDDMKRIIDQEIDVKQIVSKNAEKVVNSLELSLTEVQKEQLISVLINFAETTSKETLLTALIIFEQMGLFEIIRK